MHGLLQSALIDTEYCRCLLHGTGRHQAAVQPTQPTQPTCGLVWAWVLAEPLSWHAAGKPRFSITGEWDKGDDLGAAIDRYQVHLEKQTARSVQV